MTAQPSTIPEAYTDHFHATPDGPRLHYRDYPAVGATTGVPVLCLHGLTRNVKDFGQMAPRIAATGRRVLVVSMRGRGLSDADPKPERYQPLTYAIDVIGLLNVLDLERAVFIGTSMGGLITMIIASIEPQRISAAVLNDIGPQIDQAGLDRIMSNVSSRDPAANWAEAIERTKSNNIAAFPNETGDAFWEELARNTWVDSDDGRLVYDYDGAIIEEMGKGGDVPNLWPMFEPFATIDTLCIRGGISDLLSVAIVAEMKRRKPDLLTVEVPDVGHAPFLTEPEAWVALEDFLGKVE
jgi:pimeloyl-ACP methyl ester carboxylesterase